MKEWQIDTGHAGRRLDHWCKQHLPHIPYGALQKNLRKGLIRCNGKKVEASYRLQEGDVLRIHGSVLHDTPAPKTPRHIADHDARMLRDAVLYQDDHIIVLNKPAGLAVQGGSKQSRHLDGMLTVLQGNKQESPRLVHRLDKDTSGCLMLARTASAAAKLGMLLKDGYIHKTYMAVIVGVPHARVMQIALPLIKRGKTEKMVVDEEEGMEAITEYTLLDRVGTRCALVKLEPVTGRTHQLRVHMAALDCPILGDGKYGGRQAFIEGLDLPEQLHLHARELVIEGLNTKPLHVRAPLPLHMCTSMEALGLERGDA